MANKRVDVFKEDGSRFLFKPNPREDEHAPPPREGPGLRPVHKASEDIKKEAQEMREAVRKAGLLP